MAVLSLPNLAIGGDKGVFTPRYSFQDIVPQVFHKHLLLAFHVFDHDFLDDGVMVTMEDMLVSHDASSALLIPHFDQYCAKDRLRKTVARVSRELPDCLNDISVDIDTRGTNFRK